MNIRDLWDNIKRFYIHVIGSPRRRGEVKDDGAEQISEEIKAKNLPNLVRNKFIASRSSAKPKPKQNKYKENHTSETKN